MKIRCLTLAAALALAVSPFAAVAQASARPPNAAASGSSAGKPAQKLLTPAQKRESATAPGDLRPERPVTPQITIPLGKKPLPAGKGASSP